MDKCDPLDKYRKFCITDAISHMEKAKEALEEGLRDPKKWYDDARVNALVFAKIMPAIYILQQEETRKLRTEAEEN